MSKISVLPKIRECKLYVNKHDIRRIRPTLESLQQGKYDAISKQMKYFELFEMVGVVTGFDLRTEKVGMQILRGGFVI